MDSYSGLVILLLLGIGLKLLVHKVNKSETAGRVGNAAKEAGTAWLIKILTGK